MHRNRAWRRNQRQKKIREVYDWVHAQNWFARIVSGPGIPFDEYVGEQIDYARKRAGSPKPCSGWCCGNPRTHFGTKTLTEFRFDISCEEEYDEHNIRRNFNIGNRSW